MQTTSKQDLSTTSVEEVSYQYVHGEILFDQKGKSTFASLNIESKKEKWKRIHTGAMRDSTQEKKIEITSRCTDPLPKETLRICLPKGLYVSVFAPRFVDSHAARSLFQIRGYEEVWIHDLNIIILPHLHWKILHDKCLIEDPQLCEDEYRKKIQHVLSNDDFDLTETISGVFFGKKGLSEKNKFDCIGMGEFTTPTKQVTWKAYQKKCNSPYTGLWNYWKKNMDVASQIRRMGSVFFLYDNNKVTVDNIKIRGITSSGMIRATNNGTVLIENSTLEGISQGELESHGISFSDVDGSPEVISKERSVMGTGISVLEGRQGKAPFSCSVGEEHPKSFGHRKNCIGRSQNTYPCRVDRDCSTQARCVLGTCKSNSCDTKHIMIRNNRIAGCSQVFWGTKEGIPIRFNDDGIQLTSISAEITGNQIVDFEGCDSLVDLGHRGGCTFREGEAAEQILVQNNMMRGGKVKTTGASGGEHKVRYESNHFYNVRLSDYHQYWVSQYIRNSWMVSQDSDQKYLWGERASIGAQPWQEPYYGRLEFIENNIENNKKSLILLFTKRWNPHKLLIKDNHFMGDSYIWLKSEGEQRKVEESKRRSLQFFPNQDWSFTMNVATQSRKTIRDWNTFASLLGQNNQWSTTKKQEKPISTKDNP